MNVVWIATGLVLLVAILALKCLVAVVLPLRAYRLGRLLYQIESRPVGYSVETCGDVPYLVEGGIPYEAGIDRGDRPVLSLSGEWKLRLDPQDQGLIEGWFAPANDSPGWDTAETITLPSTLNHAGSDLENYLGAAWFARRVSATDLKPLLRAGDRWLRLHLEGFLIRATVWANGHEIFNREGGYTDGYADLSPVVGAGQTGYPERRSEAGAGGNPEQKEPSVPAGLWLVIRVDNRHLYDSLPMRLGRYHTPGWHTYLGIHRDLHLESVPDTWVFKCDVRNVDGGFSVTVLAQMRTESARPALTAKLTGPQGAPQTIPGIPPDRSALAPGVPLGSRPAGTILVYRFNVTPENLVPWSPDSPTTYTLLLSLSTGDQVTVETGWRTVTVAHPALLLNGKMVTLRGISKHEDHPDLGATNPPDLALADLGLIRDMNANYVRTAHYPHVRHELATARDLGLLIAEEIPFYQAGNGFIHWYADKRPLWEFPAALFGLRQLTRRGLLNNARRQILEMVERDRNNPAVILWGIANESFTLGTRASRVHRWLHDSVRTMDDSRPTTLAEFTYGRPILDRMRRGGDAVDVLSVNAYYGWYYGSHLDLEERLAELHRRFPDKPIILSEFGAGAVKGRTEADGPYVAPRIPPGRTFSEEYQCTVLRRFVEAAGRLPYVCGVSPWVFADFLCTEFPQNPEPNTNLKGVVTSNRRPKESYAMLKELYRGTVAADAAGTTPAQPGPGPSAPGHAPSSRTGPGPSAPGRATMSDTGAVPNDPDPATVSDGRSGANDPAGPPQSSAGNGTRSEEHPGV